MVGQATEDNNDTMHAHCMLDTCGFNTHSEYVITIAFPLQLWFHKRSSVLRYTFIVCLEYKPDDGPAGLKLVAFLNWTFVMQPYDVKCITQIKFLW